MKTLFALLRYSYQIHSYSKFETKREVITMHPTARLGISQLLAFGKATDFCKTIISISTAAHEGIRTDHLSLINSAAGHCRSIYFFFMKEEVRSNKAAGLERALTLSNLMFS